jgi:hypothetical protein
MWKVEKTVNNVKSQKKTLTNMKKLYSIFLKIDLKSKINKKDLKIDLI